MDPIEDFNFKPINEGLGFHRKKIELKEEIKSSRVVSEAVAKNINLKPKSEPQVLKTPLPRNESISSTPNPSTRSVIDELVRNFKKPNETFIEEVNHPKVIINPTKPQVDEAANPLPWMMSPFFVDAMLVIALVLSCLLITLLVTNADLLVLIMQNPSDFEFWLTFPAIAIGMTFTYMVLTRIFLGSSLGEMVFDFQLGTMEQRQSIKYGLQVIFRTLIVLFSGLIILPILSILFRKDLIGNICGLRLFKRKRQ